MKSSKKPQPSVIEIDRYELLQGPQHYFDLDRRQFLKYFGGGIVLIVPLSKLEAQGESGRARTEHEAPREIGAWIHIDEDGAIQVFTGKAEMGQNIRTSLSQAVADELHAPVSMVRLVMADTDLTPFDMGTFGSLTTPRMAPQLRAAAAAARELLIDLAAKRWNADRNTVRIENGKFTHGQASDSLTFADLAKGQKLIGTIPENPTVTSPTEWIVSGTSIAKVDAQDFVTGKHRYTSDMKRPGMLYGIVRRPDTLNATLVSADLGAAKAIPGVTVVQDGDFIGVAAADRETAEMAVESIKAEWKSASQPSNAELNDILQKPATKEGAASGPFRSEPIVQGSVEQGLNEADSRLEQTYTVAYIAHAPLEPRAAVAEWQNEKLTVWTGTQRPFGVRGELAQAFRIPEEKVRVIVPDTGSGYGGKHTGECAIEAARIAQAAGKPVKLVWTREEEFTWAYFRPAGVIRIRSGTKKDGTITAWDFHNYNSGPSGLQIKYDILNHNIEFHAADSPLRQGSYRGLAATANHFARESHIDELAHSIKMDPLEFRLHNTKDERLKSVLNACAQKFDWAHRPSSAGHGFGIACGFEKNSYFATCAEISVEPGGGGRNVRIVRVVEAFDCGAVVNPNHLKNQIEGAIAMGIGGALFEEIQFENGKILNPRFSRYRVPRFSDMPSIEAVLVDRKDIPSAGAGETPIMGIAPAVSNAIFQASGVRLRSLPLVPNGLSPAKS